MTEVSALTGTSSAIIQLIDENDQHRGDPLDLPLCTSADQLQKLCNLADLENQEDETIENTVPYEFYIDDRVLPQEGNILELIKRIATENHERIVDFKERKNSVPNYDLEQTLKITCVPQALFRIKPVSRCSSTIPGHEEAITIWMKIKFKFLERSFVIDFANWPVNNNKLTHFLIFIQFRLLFYPNFITVQFSPDGKKLASGSGDTTVRTWNLNAECPAKTLSGHKNHVLVVAWSLDSKFLVSADKTGVIFVWNWKKGTVSKGPLREHRNWVTGMAFQPLHLAAPSRNFVTSSKDCTAKV